MNFSPKLLWRSLLAAAMILALLLPAAVFAQDGDHTGPNPFVKSIVGPRTDPAPIPHHEPLKPNVIQENLNNLPPQASEAESVADRDDVEGKPGILKIRTDLANGTTLDHSGRSVSTCNNFNKNGDWASRSGPAPRTDIWTDHFGGWGTFAVDDGYYQAKNTVFTKENVVGPGANYDDDGTGDGDTVDGRHSVAIGSTEPYAGGYGSPMFAVPPGSEVTVVARYLIFNHGNQNYDWASLGVKPEAESPWAVYVNGYTRGQWAEMRNTITAGDSGHIMVLLNGESPTRANSKIYFDDVEIWVDGVPMASCTYE
jgi:hypothetical protein